VAVQSDDAVDFFIFEYIAPVCCAFADWAGCLDSQRLLDAVPAGEWQAAYVTTLTGQSWFYA
jgi:hypothetical protein